MLKNRSHESQLLWTLVKRKLHIACLGVWHRVALTAPSLLGVPNQKHLRACNWAFGASMAIKAKDGHLRYKLYIRVPGPLTGCRTGNGEKLSDS